MPIADWHAPTGFDTSEEPENHPDHVIALRLSGALVRRVSSNRRPVERLPIRGFSTHPSGRDLRFVADRQIRYVHLYICKELLGSVAEALGRVPRDLLDDNRVMWDDAGLLRLIEDYAAAALAEDARPVRLEMDSRANLLLLQLLRCCSSDLGARPPAPIRGGLAPWQVRRITDYLEANLERDVSLAELASLLGLSQPHLCRAFHASTGHPPHRWLVEQRVARARHIMTADPRITLTEVALSVGYASQTAFGAAFRRSTGMTPSTWRRTQLR